jgi:dephospho-CoA kinase
LSRPATRPGDEVWLVVCKPDVQLARLVRRGVPEKDARQRIAAQAASLPLWRSAATRIIETDGERSDVEKAVAAALADLLARGRSRPSQSGSQ